MFDDAYRDEFPSYGHQCGVQVHLLGMQDWVIYGTYYDLLDLSLIQTN